MNGPTLHELQARIDRLEDDAAIRRLIMSYGPAADAGLTSVAASVWLKDGVYDWDGKGEPYRGSVAIDEMLQGSGHQGLIAEGVAHFAGPILLELDGDQATALNYSMVMRRDADRFYVWRVSAVRWDVERTGSTWRVRRRTNRLLDETGGGREMFRESLHAIFGEGPK